jgi:hypothetical protein
VSTNNKSKSGAWGSVLLGINISRGRWNLIKTFHNEVNAQQKIALDFFF